LLVIFTLQDAALTKVKVRRALIAVLFLYRLRYLSCEYGSFKKGPRLQVCVNFRT
jgi:hypothetical protein